MPLPARGDRQGETLCQSVSLRAVADERQKRTPLFFQWSQLLQDVIAVERFDLQAQRVASRNRFGPREIRLSGARQTVNLFTSSLS